jgi:hypothetical protein
MKINFLRILLLDMGNRLDQTPFCAVLPCIKIPKFKPWSIYLQKCIKGKISKLCIHVSIIFFSLHKFSHIYFSCPE